MTRSGPTRVQVAVGVVVAVSFATAILSMVLGGSVVPRADPGSHSFSRSALGYQAFVALLERLEVPVLVSRHDSAARAGERGTLVLAEPPAMANVVQPLLDDARTAIVILPKWQGERSSERPGWISGADLRPVDDVEEVLALVAPGEILRPTTAPRSWSTTLELGSELAPALTHPQLFRIGEYVADMEPIVWSDEGVLVGELRRGTRRIWIVSDPDLLSTHGLGRGDNAILAVSLVETLRGGKGALIVDETIHGFQSEPSLWRALLEFPLVLGTLQALVCVLVLIWAAAGRFGAPDRASAPFASGADHLIGNTAALLELGGHAHHTLRRYHRTVVREVAQKLHASPRLTGAELVAWLDQIGRSRGTASKLAALERDIEAVLAGRERASAALAVAKRLHEWREEMLHGHRSRT